MINSRYIHMKQFILFLFVLVTLHSFAQTKGIVYYGQIKSPGMEAPSGPDLNAYLVFNKTESYYVTAKDSLEQNTNNELNVSPETEIKAVYNGQKTFRYGEQVYYNYEKDSLWWSKMFGEMKYVAEKRPRIDWKLEKETKKIGNFTAHKAVGKFRGRKYTAWYTTEIPLPYGPWKLQGLPGLILEAHDELKEMYLYFKSLEYPTNNKAAISMVKRPKGQPEEWITLEDFADMLRESMEKAYNRSVLMAEQYNFDKPKEKPKMREIYIESFE